MGRSQQCGRAVAMPVSGIPPAASAFLNGQPPVASEEDDDDDDDDEHAAAPGAAGSSQSPTPAVPADLVGHQHVPVLAPGAVAPGVQQSNSSAPGDHEDEHPAECICPPAPPCVSANECPAPPPCPCRKYMKQAQDSGASTGAAGATGAAAAAGSAVGAVSAAGTAGGAAGASSGIPGVAPSGNGLEAEIKTLKNLIERQEETLRVLTHNYRTQLLRQADARAAAAGTTTTPLPSRQAGPSYPGAPSTVAGQTSPLGAAMPGSIAASAASDASSKMQQGRTPSDYGYGVNADGRCMRNPSQA
jgi:hypothetical protein